MNFEIEDFLIQNNFVLIMDKFKHESFCTYFKNKFLSKDKNLFESKNLSLIEKYQKNYFFRNFFFSRSIPLNRFILTIDSFNLYFSSNLNLEKIQFVLNHFKNDYSVFLYDPLIVFNHLLIYFFNYNFLSQNFNSDQNFEILELYLSHYSLKEFNINISDFKEIENLFFSNNLEQHVFENFFLVLIHVYSLFYRINFEIYLDFHFIEINILILTIHSLIQMDRPREFSLFQFDISKSKQVEKICNGFMRRKNLFTFFIAFTFYLLPGIVWIFWLEYTYSFTIFGGVLRSCFPGDWMIRNDILFFIFLFLDFFFREVNDLFIHMDPNSVLFL